MHGALFRFLNLNNAPCTLYGFPGVAYRYRVRQPADPAAAGLEFATTGEMVADTDELDGDAVTVTVLVVCGAGEPVPQAQVVRPIAARIAIRYGFIAAGPLRSAAVH